MSINNLNTYLNVRDAHLRVVSGNVYAQAMNIGGINVETAHGLQSVSDTGNVTSNTLQFSNATTGFVTTANVNIGRDLVVTGNATVSTDLTVSANATVTDTLTVSEHLLASKEATVTGNLHVTTIMSDSNVVAEYTGPHDRPLRKYPEVAMTQNDESATSGYVAIASSTATYDTNLQPENAFNGVISPSSATSSWQSSDSGYSGTTPFNYLNAGTHTVSLTDTDGTVHYGDWLSLQTPNRIKVSYYKIHTLNDVDNYRPDSFVLLGSNSETDGTWKLLHTETSGMTDPGPEVYTGHVNSTEFYTYHRLLVKSLAGNGGEAYINELEYYGHEEGSGSLDTTLKSVYNVPATTGTQLEVYYDAKDLTTMPSTVTDLSPNTNNGTLNGGVGFDSIYKAFTFDGTDDYILTDVTNPEGAFVHSVSTWVKADTMTGSNDNITQIGKGADAHTKRLQFCFVDIDGVPGQINLGLSGSSVKFKTNLQVGVWYHLVYTYNGGAAGAGSTSYNMYVNGVSISVDSGSGSGVLNLDANAKFAVGGHHLGTNGFYFDGSIANVRLYSKALNVDQVKELYDYQKDYFLGSKSQVTLYKGHLGVGVTEPSGQLELAGDERIQEYPPRDLGGFETMIEGEGTYKVSSSSDVPNPSVGNPQDHPATAFTANDTFFRGVNSAYAYNTTVPAIYTGTHFTNGVGGDFIQIELPHKIYLKSINITSRTNGSNYSDRAPHTGFIFGSNNGGTTWSQVASWTGLNWTLGESKPIQINSNTLYSTYRLVANELVNSSGGASRFNIDRWQLFGTPGPTTLDKGSLSLTRSLDVPRVSRYDVDTETPRPEKLVVDFDTTVNSSPTDISGQGNHGTFNGGASYSAADKAFVFDGSNDYIQGNLNNTGDTDFTVSCWFKRTADDGVETVWFIGGTSSNNPGNGTGLDINTLSDTRGYFYFYSGYEIADSGLATVIGLNKWVHLVCTRVGNTMKLYLNGEDRNKPVGGTAHGLSLAANTVFRIGQRNSSGTNPAHGMVSNFKIYSVALEPSEVKKLYNLSRTGRSMVISDTAVGIGRAPEAQLDVRGVIRGPGLSIQTVSSTKTDTSFFSGSSTTDIGGLSITIQPKFANSKIYVGYHILYGGWGRNFFRLKRTQGSSTSYFLSDLGPQDHGSTSRSTTTDSFGNNDASTRSASFFTLDDANSLEPITYTVQGWTYHGSYYVCVNRGYNEGTSSTDLTYRGRGISSISAQEVCQ